MIKVRFLNSDGTGFEQVVEVAEGTKLSDFIAKQMPDSSPNKFKIRVNRETQTADYELRENDRIVATYAKIEGAIA